MESYEPTRAVFSRVQSIDPKNAMKIMGYILLHYDENDMMRFACGPETLVISIVNRAKTELGLLSNTSSAPGISPFSNPIAISRPNPLSHSLSSPRLHKNGFNPSSPSSPSVWPHHHSVSLNANPNLSYASAVNGASNTTNGSLSSSLLGSPQIDSTGNRAIFADDYHLQDQNSSFYSDSLALPSKNMDFEVSPGCRSDSVLYPYAWGNSNGAENNAHVHRRSSSFNDVYLGIDDSTYEFGYKLCPYYAKGFCKNGSTCKFVHCGEFSDSGDNCTPIVGSPCKYDAFEPCQEDILRSKSAHQRRLAAQLMASGVNPYTKLNFLQYESQRSAALALMMKEEFHKLNRARMLRNEFSGMGMRVDSNPASRQIYLTFPADSTFKEDDVSQYFGRFGRVQDVRIPYQQKRMFGFVTFVFPETVNIILAKGNPHFVCDSRVLVKPYKEKGKLPDKKQHQQQLERAEFLCLSPSGLDSREDPFDFQLGGRMSYSTQEMLLKHLEEQADLQQALELQGKRMVNLQLLDLNNRQHHQHNLAVGSPVLSPIVSQASLNHNALPPSDRTSHDVPEESKESPTGPNQQQAEKDNAVLYDNNSDVRKEDKLDHEESELLESLEHVLPDNLFASPTKLDSEIQSSVFNPALAELDDGAANSSSMAATSPRNNKSCLFEMPRLSSEHETLGIKHEQKHAD